MFAPAHHAATRHVVPVRKALGVSTIFNLLGPLTNPAGAARQLIGVWEPARLDIVAEALVLLGTGHAMVVSSSDGLDEISISGPTEVREVTAAGVEVREVTPAGIGVEEFAIEELPGGDAAASASIVRGVLAGEPGAAREIVAANAAAAIYLSGIAGSLAEGVVAAREAIDSGAALDRLDRYVQISRKMSAA